MQTDVTRINAHIAAAKVDLERWVRRFESAPETCGHGERQCALAARSKYLTLYEAALNYRTPSGSAPRDFGSEVLDRIDDALARHAVKAYTR